jgi:hypothetical protein
MQGFLPILPLFLALCSFFLTLKLFIYLPFAFIQQTLNRNPTPDINSSIEIKLRKRLKQQNGKDTVDLIKYKSKVLEENI